MNVEMKDGLAGGLSVINPYIETVRFVFFLQETAAFPEEAPERAALVRRGQKNEAIWRLGQKTQFTRKNSFCYNTRPQFSSQ